MSQKRVHENHEMSQALYEDLAALKIRIAFAEISEAELDDYDRELLSVSESDYSEAAQKRAIKLIEQKLNKRLRRQFVSKTLPHMLQIVTISLLLFFIGLTAAVATVHPVRLRILDFIAKIEENYSEISLFNDIDNAIVPSEWEGKYYPTYIPESFELAHVDGLLDIVYYTSAGDRVLQFSEYEENIYTNVDIDKERSFDITINENSGLAMSNGEDTTITWCVDNTYLYLHFSGNLDEAKRIAESVRLLS